MRDRSGRYPHEYLTREDLGPTERHRATVFLRDDYRCLAAGSRWTAGHPCAGGLALVRALPLPADATAELGPLYLRTLCTVHATLARALPAFASACRQNGWTLPVAADLTGYAARVPVRYPGSTWYRLDDWGERAYLTRDEVLRARRALGLPTGRSHDP